MPSGSTSGLFTLRRRVLFRVDSLHGDVLRHCGVLLLHVVLLHDSGAPRDAVLLDLVAFFLAFLETP